MTLRRSGTALAVVLAAAVAVLGVGSWNARQLAAKERDASRVATTDVAAQLAVRTADIAFYEKRIAEDPASALDRTQAASLLMQRARETNSYGDYLRAETLVRESLALSTSHNSQAYAVLSSALLAQHRFLEARDAARALVQSEPTIDAYRSMLGEACLEAGDYDGARVAFDSISPSGRASLAVAPRLARWAEIRGDTATTRRLVHASVNTVSRLEGVSREQAAWFHLRAADFDLRYRNPRRAETLLQEGLALNPGDVRLLTAMARVRAAVRDWRGAITYGDSAISVALDPATLGIVSDAYSQLGDTARAAEYFTAMEAAVGQQPGMYHRAWSLFLLDHGQRVDQVLAAAQAEIRSRPDVYGYDLLAWALFKRGRVEEAQTAMHQALAQGTRDPQLLQHAAAITAAAAATVAAHPALTATR